MLNVNDVNQIYLGCQGENLARTIVIDVKPWLVAYPSGVVTIYHKRNGASEATPTGAVFDAEKGTVTWKPTSTDTYVFGEGEAEIRLTEGTVIKKSRDVKTDVAKSVTGKDGEALGSGWQDYLDAIQRAAGVAIIKNGQIRFAINSAGHLILSYTDDVPIPADENDETTEAGDVVWTDKDLGPVDVYAEAVAAGYTGTKEEWLLEVGSVKENAQAAAGSATAAAGSATAAAGSATSAAASAADALQHTQSVIETWLGNNIDPDSGYALDRTLALPSAAAPADMVGDIKSALSEVSYNLWEGYVSYTFVRYITITGLNIPAGTYTLSALVTSTDTDTPDVCRILFKSGSTNVDYFYLNRDTRSSKKITLNTNCDTVLLYAAETSNDAAGDTATWKDIMLVSGDVNLPYRPHYSAVDYKLRQDIEAEKAIVDVEDFNGTLANTENWEAGTISDTTGEDESQANSIRTKKMIRTSGVKKIFVRVFYETPDSRVDVSTTDNYNYRYMYLYQYRSNGTFIGRLGTSGYTKVYTLNSECEYVRMAFWTRLSNSSIATIMPSTIDFYSADDEYFLPRYYDTYLSQKASVIEEYARAAGGDGAVFAFITDQHSPDYNEDWSPAILHRLSELVHIPIIFNGGDLSHTGHNPDHYADLQRKNYDGEIHHAVGNHDFLALTLGKSLYYDMDIYNRNQVGSVDHHYYYVDNEQLKIRFIVLAAYMESKKALDPSETSTKAQGGYTSDQISWINNVALDIPEGWKAIVFTHYFYMLNYDGEADPPYPATLSYGTVILRSINANGNVICVVQGHTHDDRIIKQHGTGEEATWAVPIIMTTSDKNRVYMNDDTPEEHWIVNRSTGTVYEQAFDVIIVNQNTRKINVVRIGGMADSGVNDNRGTAVEVREVTY